MAEGWTTESVLKEHGLWRDLAGPLAGPTAIKLQWQDMQLEKLRAENQQLRECLSEIEDFARGEGDVGNVIARKAAAILRPETAPLGKPAGVRMTNEEWYDTEISPKLLELAEECGKRGLSFVSVVEYEPGGQALTRRFTEDAGLAMVMIDHCAKTAPNLDGFVIGLEKYCREKGIDTGASIVMRKIIG